MKKKFIKIFTRDMLLSLAQIWYRGEATNSKQWTKEKQPHMPFIVFEKTPDTVYVYYDIEGVVWIKNLILKRAREDKTFISMLKKNIEDRLPYCEDIFTNMKPLSKKEFIRFVEFIEEYWIWFEIAWWLWDSTPEELEILISPV